MERLISIGFMFLFGIPVIEGACDKDWTQFGSKCYQLQKETKAFNSAHQTCLDKGAVLVCIEDGNENDFIQTLNNKPTWIGIVKPAHILCSTCTTPEELRSDWRCASTGTPGSFWKDDQPNSNTKPCAFMDTDGTVAGWAVADCDTTMPFVCESGESTGGWQGKTTTTVSTTPPTPTPAPLPTLAPTPLPTLAPTPLPTPTPTTTASTTTIIATTTIPNPATSSEVTQTESSSTTPKLEAEQSTSEEDGSSTMIAVTTTSNTTELPGATSAMSQSEYIALYAGLGGLGLVILIVVILIPLTVKSRKSKIDKEKAKETNDVQLRQRPDIVPQIDQQDDVTDVRESYRRPALASVGFMPAPGSDGIYNSIVANQSETMTYTRPPEAAEYGDIAGPARSHKDASLLGIDPPLRRPSGTASTLTESSLPSAIPYRPVSYAGLDEDDPSPYGETMANTKKGLPRHDQPSVIDQPTYQTTLPTSSNGVDHVRTSRVLQDGSVMEDIYALPAKRKSILRRSNATDFMDNPIYEY